MDEREPGLDIDWRQRRVTARGVVPAVAVVVLILLLLAAAAPAYVLHRSIVQIGREVDVGFQSMRIQHERLIDLYEATAYTFMPPEIQRRMTLPKWVREKIDEAQRQPSPPPDVSR